MVDLEQLVEAADGAVVLAVLLEEGTEFVDEVDLVVDVLDLFGDLEGFVPVVEGLVRLVEVDEAGPGRRREGKREARSVGSKGSGHVK